MIRVRPLATTDQEWLGPFLRKRWGSDTVVGHNTVYHPAELAGHVALEGDDVAGLVTYHIVGGACEVVTIDAVREHRGTGTALLEAVHEVARKAGCSRTWLVTTNDNVDALRFYQRRGFELVAVHRGALEAARRLKPEIALVGNYGIPIRDEIELEYRL